MNLKIYITKDDERNKVVLVNKDYNFVILKNIGDIEKGFRESITNRLNVRGRNTLQQEYERIGDFKDFEDFKNRYPEMLI